MIQVQHYGVIAGRTLVRTYSDANMMISRAGILYVEAVDPIDEGRVYLETDVPIPSGSNQTDPDEATVEDYQEALEKLGVDLDG